MRKKISSKIVSKMQKEFQPDLDSSFKQGMYSGYAFGLQDGYKYAIKKHLITNKDIKEYLNKEQCLSDGVMFRIGMQIAKDVRDNKIKNK